jgi:hypothetical protein
MKLEQLDELFDLRTKHLRLLLSRADLTHALEHAPSLNPGEAQLKYVSNGGHYCVRLEVNPSEAIDLMLRTIDRELEPVEQRLREMGITDITRELKGHKAILADELDWLF